MPVSPSSRSLPYVAPFLALLVAMTALPAISAGPRLEWGLQVVVLGGVVWWIGRPAISLALVAPLGSVLMGVLVFAVWVGPDLLVRGWHEQPLFRNALTTGGGSHPFAEAARHDALVLCLRSVRAVVLVPIIEEVFWRGWLPRWIVDMEFARVPLGRYSAFAFVVTAVLFASEHGAFWDVGLAAGVLYNLWMLRTKSLGDCILAHVVTNGCLAAHVMLNGQWDYW